MADRSDATDSTHVKRDDQSKPSLSTGTASHSPIPPDEAGPRTDSTRPAEKFRQSVAEKRAGLDDFDPEEVLWEGGFSPKAMIGSWLLCLVLTVGILIATGMLAFVTWPVAAGVILLIWVIAGAQYLLRRLGIHYKLTTQRFIHKTGILRRVTDRIEVIDIDDVHYEQGPIQRISGVGTIRIVSSDRTHPEVTMLGIDSVDDVAGLIDDIRRKERKRRSLHIETI